MRSILRLALVTMMTTLLVGGVGAALPDAPPFSRVYVFGDSNVDNGNIFIVTGGTIPQSPPYDMGRWSNGPLWVEVMADELGLPHPAPNLAGGTNYAWGGANTGPGLSDYGTPNIGMQIDFFLAAERSFHGDELIVLQAGFNDLFFAPNGLGEIANHFEDHITELAAAGGRSFLVATVAGDRAPSVVGTSDENRYREQVVSLNRLLEKRLEKLAEELGVTIDLFDFYAVTKAVFADPNSYHLTNVKEGFRTGAGSVGDPDGFFWWDDFHLTRVAHRIVGEAAAEFVCEVFAAP
jgi:phospholipase/lecithinase/hemolysin